MHTRIYHRTLIEHIITLHAAIHWSDLAAGNFLLCLQLITEAKMTGFLLRVDC